MPYMYLKYSALSSHLTMTSTPENNFCDSLLRLLEFLEGTRTGTFDGFPVHRLCVPPVPVDRIDVDRHSTNLHLTGAGRLEDDELRRNVTTSPGFGFLLEIESAELLASHIIGSVMGVSITEVRPEWKNPPVTEVDRQAEGSPSIQECSRDPAANRSVHRLTRTLLESQAVREVLVNQSRRRRTEERGQDRELRHQHTRRKVDKPSLLPPGNARDASPLNRPGGRTQAHDPAIF